MENWRHLWPVETICRVMRISSRGYRSWRTRPISQRTRTDMAVLAHIREQYSLSLGSYGRPRMTMELKEGGLDVGERRVGRLMRINGIKPVRTRRHKVTTDSNHRLGVAANWQDGDFVAATPNQKWAEDITYIWTHEGWLYLAVILDLHSRRVVGWAVSDRVKKDLAIRALDMAVNLRKPAQGCIFHSDRGSQYCSYDYQKKLQAYGLRPSMSGKGNCYDNASVETFFKSLKAELIWRQKWPTRRQRLPSSSTSTGSTTPDAAIHTWAASARSHSKARWHNEISDRHKTVISPERLAPWREALNVGDRTNCGMVVDTRGPIVKVQLPANISLPSGEREFWARRSELTDAEPVTNCRLGG